MTDTLIKNEPSVNSWLYSSIKRYLTNVKNIPEELIEFYGFPINYSNFCINELFKTKLENTSRIVSSLVKSNEFKLVFYSLHGNENDSSLREYWNKITIKFNGDDYYIFLYDAGGKDLKSSENIYQYLNSTNSEFCHSMLLRDYISNCKKGFDVDIAININEFEHQLNYKIAHNKEERAKKNVDLSNRIETLSQKIVESINKYFPKVNLNQDKFKKYITDIYAYNLNSKAFTDINTSEIIFDDIKFKDVEFGHGLYGSVINEMKKVDTEKDISKLSKWQVYLDILSDLTKLIVHYNQIGSTLKNKILLLDDRPQNIKKEIEILECWLGKDTFVNKSNDTVPYEEFDKIFNALESRRCQDLGGIKDVYDRIVNNKDNKQYNFIVIDLDYEGELKGFDYLRELRKAKSIYEKPYVIVFTRKQEPEAVEKALNMGALFVVSKQNFARLLQELYKVLPLIRRIDDTPVGKDEILYPLGENWSLLYRLPLRKILELKSYVIQGDGYKPYEKENSEYGFNDDELESDYEYLWIKKLPKAELHNHIGSVLGPKLIPPTSLLVLSQKYAKHKEYKNIKTIVDFILPIVTDPFLSEDYEKKYLKYNSKNGKWATLKHIFICDKDNQYISQSIFNVIIESLNLNTLSKTPEEVLLSPQDDTLEKYFRPFSRLKKSEYFKNKLELRERGVSYDEVMLFFILLLKIRELLLKNEKPGVGNVLKGIRQEIISVFKKGVKRGAQRKQRVKKRLYLNLEKIDLNIKRFSKELQGILNNCLSDFKIEFNGDKHKPPNDMLKFLISAHSMQRCLTYHNRGLFNYLRGCEYGGAPHLQCKESIYLAAHHIIFEYAIPDNIRYLDLRSSIDGYNKFKLFKNNKDIVDSLKQSFSDWQSYALDKENKKVHVNLIMTAKRHKSIKDFENNVELTINNYRPLKTTIVKDKSFFEIDTEIVSFDIAGLEKNNRLTKFEKQIKPLLDNCVPITMHAGEEDSHEAIWEAFYLAHAQRLGHALTLKDNDELMNLVRESFVNIELCPISNYLTNNKYSFSRSKRNRSNEYPLKQYLKDRLSVSINTDNPYVSDSTLSKEFLFAAKISGGLTKWEILKLILYSFKSITIHKSLRSRLMKEINEEIFQLMLNESE